jgi:ferredoxin
VTLQKYFSHPSLVIYFLATQLIKRKGGQQIGEGLLVANHLEQSLYSNPIVIITLFFAGALRCCDLSQPCKLCTYVGPNHFFLRQTGIFSLFFIQFYCADHMLSTAGDALRTCPAAALSLSVYHIHCALFSFTLSLP